MKKVLHIVYFTLFFIGCFQVKAQTINYKKEAALKNSNFYEIVNKTRKQFIEKSKYSRKAETRLEKKEKKQFERWVWIWKDRVNADGTFPKEAVNKQDYLNLLENKANTLARSSSTTKPWTQIGPTEIVTKNGNFDYPGPGRVDIVAVDPTDSDIMYVGTPSGGLWKTTDKGITWSPKTDNLAGMGVTDIIIDPTNTNILYMATGDRDSKHVSSIGLFKSTDAGDTWTVLPDFSFSLSDNEYIRDISFLPGTSTTILALTNDRIRKSTDSGATWYDATFTHANDYFEEFQTIVFQPLITNNIVVSDVWGGLWYSTDAGNSFVQHTVFKAADAGGNYPTQNILRLATTPADTDHFYGIDQNGMFKKYRFAFDNTAADLIKSKHVTAKIFGTDTPFDSQHGYIQCIALSPADEENLMVGGVQGWKSTDNGDTFTPILNAYSNPLPAGQIHVHADHHFLLFTDDTHIINGNDAGLRMGSFSPASDADFPDISSGLIITQSYNIAITHGLNGDDYMMANQDNDGFSKVLQGGTQKWVAAVAGDGTATAIDISNPNIRYLGGTNGQLNRTDNGYADGYDSAIKILRSDEANASFISPIATHPTNANIIYVGHGDVKRTTDKGGNVDLEYNPSDSDTFTALNSGLTKTEFLDVSLNNAAVRIFAIGEVAEVSTLKRSVNDGATWSTIASPSGVKINSVYAVPNTNTVYATVKSYSAGNKVYKSTNNGNTWSNISGNLPNIIMFKVILDPNKNNETIYLATEIGVYFTDNSTTNWSKLGTDLPNVRISDIKISPNNGNIYVGTFGRGMWVYNDQKYFDNTDPANVYWSDVSSWEGKTLPTTTDDVFIKAAEEVTLDSNGAVAKSIEIADSGFLYIEKNADLTIENNFDSNSANSAVNIYSDAADSGVLIVKGNSTGNITYVRGGLIDNKWNLITPPVSGQTVKDFAENAGNDIRKNTDTGTDPNRYAIAKYNDANNAGEKWEYFDVNVGNGVQFEKGIGYSVSRSTNTTTGQVSFTGTIQTGSLNINATHDKWVAVGNPYTAYYPANKGTSGDFVLENTAKLAIDAPAVYVWESSQEKYVAFTNDASADIKVLTPGQGFFIKMKPSGTDEMVAFNNAYLGTKTSLTGSHTFSKTAETTPFIKLFITKGEIKVNTNVIFSKDATIGFDAGKDIVNFNSSAFDLTTKLLDNSSDKDYTIQSIPNNDYENQIVPLNLTGKANDKIMFSALASNLPEGIKIFLEDKETGSSYQLSETENYTLTLTSDASGFGRFYVHFSKQVLDVVDIDATKIQIYNNNNSLQINGTTGSLKIDLFDINGKRVFNQNQTSNKFSPVDLNGFSKGVYLVKVTSEGKSVSKKIIIN
ncbi:sialidase family protein [Polaribacter sp. L3A8]|uniref:sialidase family protein n=1 Tax=Polaribacter sp. L3A8 TaxID=2686361 RepID=UPI00131AC163|nr:sialidase family protein [Polaribacter sp. L3A8]